jgi:hypothetical protein
MSCILLIIILSNPFGINSCVYLRCLGHVLCTFAIIDTQCAYCAVGTESLNIVQFPPFPPSVSFHPYSVIIFILILLLSEVQAVKTWESSNEKRRLSRLWQTLDRKVLSHFLFSFCKVIYSLQDVGEMHK